MSTTNQPTNKSFLFQVEILMESETNGKALEKLMKLLNSEPIMDYKIKHGIQLGRIIDDKLSESRYVSSDPITTTIIEKQASEGKLLSERLQQYKESNTLMRLAVLKGRGVRLSIPCRILSFDAEGDYLTIYHVDEKQVYQFHLSEIEDLSVGS